MQIPTIKEILKKNKIKIHKSLGQNFIFDQNLTDKIVSKSKPVPWSGDVLIKSIPNVTFTPL